MDYTQQPQNDPRRGYHFFQFGRPRNFPSAVKWLILINVVVYFLELVVFASKPESFLTIFGPLGLSPSDVFGRGHLWQLLTYAFLHSPVDIWHTVFNMLFLFWFGREIEQAWGTKRFVVFYLTAAVFSGLVFSVVHYFFKEVTWCIGASGAVMAVLMVYALYWPNRIILLMFIIPVRIRTFVIFLVVYESLSFLQMHNGVANMAHLGGLLYGYIIVRHGQRLAVRFAGYIRDKADNITNEDQRRLDEILDKVNRSGMNSLSWSERRFLQKISKRR